MTELNMYSQVYINVYAYFFFIKKKKIDSESNILSRLLINLIIVIMIYIEIMPWLIK